jgi:hypothetical protein
MLEIMEMFHHPWIILLGIIARQLLFTMPAAHGVVFYHPVLIAS